MFLQWYIIDRIPATWNGVIYLGRAILSIYDNQTMLVSCQELLLHVASTHHLTLT